jgi:hypothetical protein
MIIGSTRKNDSVASTLRNDNIRHANGHAAQSGEQQLSEWLFIKPLIKPLSGFARAVRVVVNMTIDASRGRYDR